MRTYLTSEYRDREKVKSLGARWDAKERRWYVPEGIALDAFQTWLPAVAEPPRPQTKTSESLDLAPRGGEVALSEPKGVSLSSLLQGVSNAIAQAYAEGVWTRVEVVKADLRNGHVYLELAERNADGDVLAQARAMIWKGVANSVVPKFTAATGVVLAAGIKLLVRAKPTLHAVYGMSLVIDNIDPSYTLGDLEAKKREIRRRLKQEGLYERNKKLPAPWDYHQVLVIAPQGAAGLGDFRAEADRIDAASVCRFSYAFSRFQGEGAAAEIREALLKAMAAWRAQEATLPDAVAIIRGGGAVNDLAWLNDYDLARTLCELDVPVLTGIGHERDDTVLDEVANQRFDTPSKAIHGIEQLIFRRAQASKDNFGVIVEAARAATQRTRLQIDSAAATARSSAHLQLASAAEMVHDAHSDVRYGALRAVREASDSAGASVVALQRHAREQLSTARARLPALVTQVKTAATTSIRDAKQLSETRHSGILERVGVDLARLMADAVRAAAAVSADAKRALVDARERSEALMREIAGQGPEKTLGRGFAMVTAEGKPITSAGAVAANQLFEIQFRDGQVRARAQDKEPS